MSVPEHPLPTAPGAFLDAQSTLRNPGILRMIPSEIDSDFPGHARPKALN
ncbi:hypothetical protein X737_19100 [Mesorhizobium sp. L48C026A00]|nr:hypothetical protein X737_19100 [Mesorhizobium sp. L48C026A00]